MTGTTLSGKLEGLRVVCANSMYGASSVGPFFDYLLVFIVTCLLYPTVGCCASGPRRIYKAVVLCPSRCIHVMRAFIVAAVVGLGSLPRALAWGAAGVFQPQHSHSSAKEISKQRPRSCCDSCTILPRTEGPRRRLRHPRLRS